MDQSTQTSQNQGTDQLADLDAFASDLLVKKGVNKEEVGEEAFNVMKEEIIQELNDWILAKMVNELPEEKIGDYNKYLEDHKDNPIEALNYLRNNISSFNQILTQSVIEFTKLYINGK